MFQGFGWVPHLSVDLAACSWPLLCLNINHHLSLMSSALWRRLFARLSLHLLFPFLIQKKDPHPLHGVMTIFHGWDVVRFVMSCQQPPPDTLYHNWRIQFFYFIRMKYLLHFHFRKVFILVVEPRFPSGKVSYHCQ